MSRIFQSLPCALIALLFIGGGCMRVETGMQTVTKAAAPSTAYYISPDGDDSHSGTLAAFPWKTFDYALPRLAPGDTLVLMDGIYDAESTGLIRVYDCGVVAGGVINGRENAPITVRALHERQAVLVGSARVIHVGRCSYWNFEGLTGSGFDEELPGVNPLVEASYSHHLVFRRMLLSRSNRLGNNAVISARESHHVLIEESEVYSHHRHAFNSWRSKYITFRRNYVHTRGHAPDGIGDEAVSFYRSSYGIAENNIVEGVNIGLHAHGGRTFDDDYGGSYNQFLGNVAIGTALGMEIDARPKPEPYPHPVLGNTVKDFVSVNTLRNGLWVRSATTTSIENVTTFGSGGSGVEVDSRGDPPCEEIYEFSNGAWDCSYTLTNTLSFDNGDHGVLSIDQHDWLIQFSNAWSNDPADYQPVETDIADTDGHIRKSMSVRPSGMGTGTGECIMFVPEGSNMKGAGRDGADIGANLLFRYEDGILTGEPLWDPVTGAFPRGAIVDSINGVPGQSLFDVHERLNVNTNGCRLPYAK